MVYRFLAGGTDKKPPRARGYAEDDLVGGICGEGGEAGPWELKPGNNGAVRQESRGFGGKEARRRDKKKT